MFSILILAGLLLAACQPAPPPPPAPTQDETQVANSVNATLTAVVTVAPTATSAPPTPTLEPTPLPPTPTPTLAPGSGDPAADLGNPDGVDTFDSPVNFGPLDTKCFSSEVTGGQFVMAAKGLAGIYCWATSWPTIQDFYIETTVVMPDSCAMEITSVYYSAPRPLSMAMLFGFNCKGEYSLKRMTGGAPDRADPAHRFR